MKIKKIIIYMATCLITFLIVLLVMFLINLYKANKMVKDFDSAFESNQKQLVFYARESCYYCQLQKPVLKQIVKDYNLKYVDIDSDMLNNKQKQHIIDKLGIEGSTPVTAVVKNKKVLNIHVGYLDGKEYVDFLIDSDILPKDAKYSKEKNINFINYNDFLKLKEGILVLGVKASPNCIDLRGILNNIASKYKLKINYLNLSNSTILEYYDIIDKLDLKNKNKLKYKKDEDLVIPMIYIIKNNEIIDIINSIDENEIINKLQKNNIIK